MSCCHPSPPRKQLEEWLASKGRAYKRPPMTLSTKKLAKKLHQSFWDGIKEEEETQEQMDFAGKIHSAVSQCLKHVEEVGRGCKGPAGQCHRSL